MIQDSIEKTLACPNCRGFVKIKVHTTDDLGIRDGTVYCNQCQEEYQIADGLFYLRKIPNIQDDRGKEWNLNRFEKRYKEIGLYKNAIEWGKYTGIPEAVSRFMYSKVKGRMLEWITPKREGLILDIGCGVGYFLFEILYRNPGRNLTLIGLDVAESNLRLLRHRCMEEKVGNIICVIADAQNIPFREGVADYIVCSEVLEHVPSPAKAIDEMSRKLKINGMLLISTPIEEANKRWRTLSSPFRFIKKLVYKRVKPPQRGFDCPIGVQDLKRYIGEKLTILDFERNAILPPEGYFKGLPDSITQSVVSVCGFIEKRFKKIFEFLAMHAVVRAQKG